MSSTSVNELTNLDSAYQHVNFSFPRTMYPVHTNVQHKQVPPITNNNKPLSSSWQPESENNNDLLARTGIQTNWQYRKYLTDNAPDLMEYNYRESNNENNIAVRQLNPPNIQSNEVNGYTHMPRMQRDILDTSHRFGQPGSDLKNMYLAKSVQENLQIAPIVIPENVIHQRYK